MKILLTLLFCTTFAFSQNKAVTQNALTFEANSPITFTNNKILGIGNAVNPGELVINNGAQISLANGGIYGDQGKIALNSFTSLPPIFNGTDAMISANASNNHAILGRASNPTDGIGVIGWSSSGASAVKALQDTYFDSPALTVWRSTKTGTNNWTSSSSPALLIAKDSVNAVPLDSSAFTISNGSSSTFDITWNGEIKSPLSFLSGVSFFEDTTFSGTTYFFSETNFSGYTTFAQINMTGANQFINWDNQNIYFTTTAGFYISSVLRVNPKYLGSRASAPAKGSVDTSLDGDTYFNSTDGRMYIQTPNGWKAITAP